LIKTYRWLYPWHEGWRLHPMRMSKAEARKCGQELKCLDFTEERRRAAKKKKRKKDVKKSKI
jgi:hypothetical protein